MSGEVRFVEEKRENYYNVSLVGEVDIYSSTQLKERLYSIIDEHKCDVKIDCHELKYIDSTGLGVFVGALKKAREYQKNIYIKNLKDNIKKLFLITGLDKLLIIEE